jgi:phage shock protein PspC (stress-responsive transcriptional regulator)
LDKKLVRIFGIVSGFIAAVEVVHYILPH